MSTEQPKLDKALLIKISEGDESAYYELFKTYSPLLRSYLLRLTRSETDTEEILQETFIRIWLYRDRLPDVENLDGWVYTIAARVCLNHWRTTRTQREKIRRLSERAEKHGTAEWDTPLEQTQVQAIRRDLQKAIDTLSEKRRKIYRLNREEGLKPAAIAEKLNMPVGTVKNQLSEALKQIRDYLASAGHHFTIIMILLENYLK